MDSDSTSDNDILHVWTEDTEDELPDTRQKVTADDRQWMENYKKLENFQNKNGHCSVTTSFGDEPLARWVCTQRASQRAGTLHNDREQLLNDLGFRWTAPVSWTDGYNQLIAFKKKNGHLQVTLQDEALYKWLKNQKQSQRGGKLPTQHAKLLTELGVEWSRPRKMVQNILCTEQWMDMYKLLVAFNEKHGHCNVFVGDDKVLKAWASSQRSRKKKRKLNENQLELLDKIGFLWVNRNPPSQKATASNESGGALTQMVDTPFALDRRMEVNGGVSQPLRADDLSNELFDKGNTPTQESMPTHCEMDA